MQIIIPMSGFGERFRRAGYNVPKPLIEIDGKPIISHVIDMFPGEKDFLFICNQEHLNSTDYSLKSTLLKYCPSARIVGIPSHKLGPIHAVRQVEHLLDLERPTVVNYCDFTCFWDWSHFKKFVVQVGCHGAIPAYKGFHPHTLGSTNYAYMRESNGWVLDIQEKKPYTNNRMEEFASSGTYYFASGKIMSDAFNFTMEQNLTIAGEYYVSLAYKSLLKKKQLIAVYPLQHFMQWGTPEDVAEYNGWSSTFTSLLTSKENKITPRGSLVLPMAGLGERFINEGYIETKPLIKVSGLPMVLQATKSLPPADRSVFILRKDMDGYRHVSELLRKSFENVVIKELDKVTNGQATTALIGLRTLEESVSQEVQGPVTFGACDYGALYSTEKLNCLMNDCDTDVIVWGVRGNANAIRNPNMFGWIDEVNGEIKNISVKVPLTNPKSDPIVLGTFIFRTPEIFHSTIERMYARKAKVNGEFYLDTLVNDAIALGMKCRFFEVDHYLSWGTPNDLRTFEYWQSCFHKWESHPYRLEKDVRVSTKSIATLEKKYSDFNPDNIMS